MTEAPKVLAGGAIPFAAFNLRDPDYREMPRSVIFSAIVKLGAEPKSVLDLGARIGMNVMEALELQPGLERVLAVEPDESMRTMCELNVLGDPRVTVLDANAGNFSLLDGETVDIAFASEAIHLFHPPDKDSMIPAVLKNVAKAVKSEGVLAFNLGPSNWRFALPVGNHRSSFGPNPEEIITELGHPLYQEAHRIALEIIKREFSDFDRENLWPPAGAEIKYEFLKKACQEAGFTLYEPNEVLSAVSGSRVLNFIRNSWTVFFRWGEVSELPAEKKQVLMEEMMAKLFSWGDFEAMKNVIAYHPTAIFTTVKA